MVDFPAMVQPLCMNLVALHNLSAKNLMRVAKLGGLPMPSIAVLPAGNRFGPYGEITLIAPLDLVDPSVESAARLYEGDAYTSTGPQAHEDDGSDLEAIVERMRSYDPFNRDDAGFFPLGRLRCMSCGPLANMAEAEAAAARVVPRDDFDEATMAMDERVLNVSMALYPHFTGLAGQMDWNRIGGCKSSMLRGLARAFGKDRRELIASLAEEGFPGLPRRLLDRCETLSRAVARIPVPYFEAKVDRGVGLGEFVAAVIPENSSPETESVLQAAGIAIVLRYEDEDRTEVVRRASELAYGSAAPRP
jgi:hypothetical protein